MNDIAHCWPEFYPEGTPPEDAVATQGESYRLVDNTPPIRDDFKSYYEENTSKSFSKEYFKLACGTSHFQQFTDIKKKRDLLPPLRSKLIARGELVEDLGLMKPTFRNSHTTVWYKTTSNPHELFEVLEEELP